MNKINLCSTAYRNKSNYIFAVKKKLKKITKSHFEGKKYLRTVRIKINSVISCVLTHLSLFCIYYYVCINCVWMCIYSLKGINYNVMFHHTNVSFFSM